MPLRRALAFALACAVTPPALAQDAAPLVTEMQPELMPEALAWAPIEPGRFGAELFER